MTPEERKKANPRVVFFAGKAAPGCMLMHFYSSMTYLTCIGRLHCKARTLFSNCILESFEQFLVLDNQTHRQRRPRHQCRPGYEGLLDYVLRTRLLRLACRDPHPSF